MNEQKTRIITYRPFYWFKIMIACKKYVFGKIEIEQKGAKM